MFFTNSKQIAKIAGVPISIDPTWIALVLMITYHVAVHNYGPLNESASWLDALRKLSIGFAVFLLIQFSILMHEFGHICAAKRYGINAQGICLGFLGGAASLDKEPQTPRQQFFITIDGPAVSFYLGTLGAVAHTYFEYWLSKDLILILQYFWVSNLVMAVFNLVPIFPLDGGRLLNSFIWWITKSRHRALVISDWSSLVLCAGLFWLGSFLLNLGVIILSALLIMRAIGSIRSHKLVEFQFALDAFRQCLEDTLGMLAKPVPDQAKITVQLKMLDKMEQDLTQMSLNLGLERANA